MKHLEFEHPVIKLHIDGETIYADWLRTTTLAEFQEVLNMSTVLTKKYNCTKWIGDARKLGIIPGGAQEWMQAVWNLEITEAGILYIAVVFSEDIFNQLSLQEYSENTNNLTVGNLITRIFPSVEEAEAWIKQVNN